MVSFARGLRIHEDDCRASADFVLKVLTLKLRVLFRTAGANFVLQVLKCTKSIDFVLKVRMLYDRY